ncbi:hypothetical protein [Microbacterium sp. G2-8]|uniref:hypothetical protein n=1 Tax=Microbacterium sp. G2-8 TaxID=2842454 RepID=UPI001C8A703B|nr:hypothetical protein [Microbacterium sp. G2-8]
MKVRAALSLLAGAFVLYFAFRGLITHVPFTGPPLAFASVLLFVAAAALALLAPGRASANELRGGPSRMPLWAAIVCVVVAGALPILSTAQHDHAHGVHTPHVTWYIGAGGILATIVCARRRPVVAWVGTAALAVTSILGVGDVVDALLAGLVGSVMWVILAQMLVAFTDRAHRDTARLALIQHQSSAWRAAQETSRRERRERVQLAIGVAGPILARVIDSQGSLTDAERAQALTAEATLRDELRGAKLLDAEVRRVIAERRQAGSVVSLYDEGGLDELERDALSRVRDELAATLRRATSERIIVRTSRLPETAVTVVGRGSGGDADVELWHEIARPVHV